MKLPHKITVRNNCMDEYVTGELERKHEYIRVVPLQYSCQKGNIAVHTNYIYIIYNYIYIFIYLFILDYEHGCWICLIISIEFITMRDYCMNIYVVHDFFVILAKLKVILVSETRE